jgi:hypothetical protein
MSYRNPPQRDSARDRPPSETLTRVPRRAAHQIEHDEIQVIDDTKSAEEKNAV